MAEHPQGFVVAPRGDAGLRLGLSGRQGTGLNAFWLLYVIAQRCRYTDKGDGLKVGQCHISTHELPLTRRQTLTAINVLKKNNIIDTKGNSMGTVVTLINTDIFDVFGKKEISETNSQKATRRPRDDQRDDHETTTNEQGNKDINKVTHPPNPPGGGTGERVSKEQLAQMQDEVEREGLPKQKEPTPFKEIVDSFNDALGSALKLVQIPTPKRKDAIAAFWSLLDQDIEKVKEYWQMVRKSPALLGRKPGLDWKASFDWLIDVEHAAKVIEGNYFSEGRSNDYEPRPQPQHPILPEPSDWKQRTPEHIFLECAGDWPTVCRKYPDIAKRLVAGESFVDPGNIAELVEGLRA